MNLKPYPFCGNDDIRLGYNGALKYWYCVKCNASSANTKEKLLPSVWNRRANDWIKIDVNNPETLPKNFKIPYIVLYLGEYYEIARYSLMKKRWFTGTSWVDDVTHYKSLPKLPEKL